MFKFFQHEKFPTFLFIFSSLLALAVFAAIFLFSFFSSVFSNVTQPIVQTEQIEVGVDTSTVNDDPYLTKIKTLKDTIKSPIISDNDVQVGDKQSKITFVQYSDYTCQFCNQQEQNIRNILSKYKDKIRYLRKDYPSGNTSSLSYKSALAARCAGAQGKYWEYHDKLIRIEKLKSADLEQIAQSNNLEMATFSECMQSKNYLADIENNILEADALDISGVPFLYINDKEYLGAVEQKEMEVEIDKLLE